MEKRVNWESTAAKIFCTASLCVLIWAAFKYFGGIILTLCASAAVSFFTDRGAAKISRHLHLPKKLCAVGLLLIFLFSGGVAVTIGAVKLYGEAEGALYRISENRVELTLTLTKVLSFFESLGERLGLSGGLSEQVSAISMSVINSASGTVLGGMGKLLSSLGNIAPRAALGVAAFLITTAYLSIDRDRIVKGIVNFIPEEYLPSVRKIAYGLAEGVLQYVKAYIILFFMTFLELYVGLLILGAPYALLISIGVAALDILPLFGVGAVIVPWAVLSVVIGKYSFGLGLLVLYGITVAVRQIAEPHIIGEKIGVHPVFSLLLMVFFFYLFGPVGAVLSPFAAILLKQLKKLP